METNKVCTRCKKEKTLSEFNNTNKQCKSCIDIRHAYYYNNLDKHKQWYREKYERHKEQMLEVRREYKKIEIECPICNCIIKKYKKAEHERTKKHIRNLEKQQP